MRRIFYVLSVIGLMIVGVGCSKIDSGDLNSDVPYYQSYQVTYYKASNTTSCAAHYLVRTATGARVELKDGASVTMNGATPSISLIDKTLYEWHGSGVFDAAFVLTKHQGKTITNVVTRSDIGDIDFMSLPDTVSKSDGFSFNWSGTALGSDEKVVVQVSNIGNQASSQNVSGNTVRILPSDLTSFEPGKLTVELIRVRTIPVQVADSGSSGITSIYYNTTKDVVLIP